MQRRTLLAGVLLLASLAIGIVWHRPCHEQAGLAAQPREPSRKGSPLEGLDGYINQALRDWVVRPSGRNPGADRSDALPGGRSGPGLPGIRDGGRQGKASDAGARRAAKGQVAAGKVESRTCAPRPCNRRHLASCAGINAKRPARPIPQPVLLFSHSCLLTRSVAPPRPRKDLCA